MILLNYSYWDPLLLEVLDENVFDLSMIYNEFES